MLALYCRDAGLVYRTLDSYRCRMLSTTAADVAQKRVGSSSHSSNVCRGLVLATAIDLEPFVGSLTRGLLSWQTGMTPHSHTAMQALGSWRRCSPR